MLVYEGYEAPEYFFLARKAQRGGGTRLLVSILKIVKQGNDEMLYGFAAVGRGMEYIPQQGKEHLRLCPLFLVK